jgi:hypothetical protein
MLTAVTIDRARAARGPWGPLAGAAIGAAFFAWIAGTRILDPISIDWLMKGDWVPHYFGWHYFRHEPWHWPPGAVHGYYAPLGTSIGLTDSIPLVGYALKPFAAWLPTPFQYLGPFLLASFALQGALGARLIARRVDAVPVQALGAALFVLLPTLLIRVGHAALCAHWLILWALLAATREPSARFRPLGWAALGLTAGMVQPYLAAMVLTVLGATAVTPSQTPVSRRLTSLGAALAATVTGWWISGLFLLSGGSSLAAGGLGYYSMNLLALVSPGDWSSFLPALPIASDGQAYEGFQYLGLGILLMIAAALAFAVRARARALAAEPPAARLWSPWLIAACLVMTAFAVSPVVTLGSRTLLNVDGPWTAPLALFRSSGRFVWPLVYLMLTSAVVTVARRGRGHTGTALLAVAVVLQLVDLRGAHTFRRQVAHDTAFHAWTDPFADARWNDVAAAYAHLVLVPPPQCGAPPLPYEGAIALTAQHGLTINAGVVARRDERAREGYCRALDAEVDAARLRDDTLYVVSPAAAGVLTRTGEGRVTCGAIGGVSFCTTPTAHVRWADRVRLD